jgi:hypothetical protein
MIRWKGALLGAATFVAAHLVQTLWWTTWFRGAYAPWFLNSGRAVALTTGCQFIAAAMASAAEPREALVRGGSIAAGAAAAMVVVLAFAGPGTLFPIVIGIGTIVLAAASLAGALAGSGLRRTIKSSR